MGFASETELPLLRSEHSRRDGKAEKKRQNRINDWKKGKDRKRKDEGGDAGTKILGWIVGGRSQLEWC